jgi:hypothetical protein
MALRNAAEISAYYRKAAAGLRPLAVAAMNAAMDTTESSLEEFAPVDTGEYKAGIKRVQISHDNVIAGFEFAAPHSPIVHFYNYGGGTRQAMRDAKHHLRNELIDRARDLVRGI